MQLTSYAWARGLQNEANKFWFYALAISILLTLYDLLFHYPATRDNPFPIEQSVTENTTKQGTSITTSESATSPRVSHSASDGKTTCENVPPRSVAGTNTSQRRTTLVTNLVIDGCDLVIPGSAVGWTPLDKTIVGTAMAISTILAGRRIWSTVQSKADRQE